MLRCVTMKSCWAHQIVVYSKEILMSASDCGALQRYSVEHNRLWYPTYSSLWVQQVAVLDKKDHDDPIRLRCVTRISCWTQQIVVPNNNIPLSATAYSAWQRYSQLYHTFLTYFPFNIYPKFTSSPTTKLHCCTFLQIDSFFLTHSI